jgi:hypothetical protein
MKNLSEGWRFLAKVVEQTKKKRGSFVFCQLWRLPRIQYGVTGSPLIWMSHSLPYFLVLHFCFTLFLLLFFKVADSITHALKEWSG